MVIELTPVVSFPYPANSSKLSLLPRGFGGGVTMIVGEGELRYELAQGWEQIPSGWSHGDVGGVATDSQDRVYVYNRSEHPLIVYDRDGKFLGSWGEGEFSRPHGITIT